jgi:hypothetical protein
MAGLLLLGLVLNQHNGAFSGTAAPTPMVAMLLSNQSAAAYLPGAFQGGENRVPSRPLEWTAPIRSISHFNPVPLLLGTN